MAGDPRVQDLWQNLSDDYFLRHSPDEIARHTLAPVYASAAVCAALHDSGVPARQLHPLAGVRIKDQLDFAISHKIDPL